MISIPIRAINRSSKFWGPDAKEFKPERWIDEGGIQGNAKDIQGHRHLLSFADGPKMCLGKTFALATFKVRNYAISEVDIDSTSDDLGNSIGTRSKLYIRIARWPRYKNRGGKGARNPAAKDCRRRRMPHASSCPSCRLKKLFRNMQ